MSELLERARRVIPNGVFGHRRSFAFVEGSFTSIPEDYPHFVEDSQGCRFTDERGLEYIDLVCGYGAMLVGYRNERVESAAASATGGTCYSFPSPQEIDLAERLVAREPSADWAAFSINGTDAILVAITIAREATNRSLIAMADGGYHGNLPSIAAGPGRVDAERCATRTFPWGNVASLQELLQAEPVAAVILCPYEQLVGRPNRLPDSNFWQDVRAACDATGTLLILDDIRSGFRLHPHGSGAAFGIDPDLVCLSKAMANGFPIAATLGTENLRQASESVFVSGTFWGFRPSMAAALATLDLLDESNGVEQMAAMGSLLRDGLMERASAHNWHLDISGPPALPLVLFSDDPNLEHGMEFARRMAKLGTLIHPTHNWFLTLAHTETDIGVSLDHAEQAFAAMAR